MSGGTRRRRGPGPQVDAALCGGPHDDAPPPQAEALLGLLGAPGLQRLLATAFLSTVRAPLGRLVALGASHSEPALYGAFVSGRAVGDGGCRPGQAHGALLAARFPAARRVNQHAGGGAALGVLVPAPAARAVRAVRASAPILHAAPPVSAHEQTRGALTGRATGGT